MIGAVYRLTNLRVPVFGSCDKCPLVVFNVFTPFHNALNFVVALFSVRLCKTGKHIMTSTDVESD